VQVLAVQREFVDDGVPYDASTRGEPIGDDDKVNYVTLAVTPEQAQLLWLASQEGALTLSLRPFGDDAAAALTPIAEPIPLP
ncbi:MAG: RcpC/CpaB family pilus assembly protein, partial [Hyphomicrobiales bacterium]